jgi:hypothetical protein
MANYQSPLDNDDMGFFPLLLCKAVPMTALTYRLEGDSKHAGVRLCANVAPFYTSSHHMGGCTPRQGSVQLYRVSLIA